MAMDLHDRIRERLAALDLTPERASRDAGLDKTFLRKVFERGGTMRAENLEAISRVLKVSPQWLLGGEEPAPELRGAEVRLPAQMPNDVPVYGTAAASHARGSFQFEGGTIDWVRRPPALGGSRNAYALYIEGTSMEPEHRAGDLRFVHPDRPARIGDTVVIQQRRAPGADIEATIGHMLGKTPTIVRLGKLNPLATVEIKRDYIVAIHKVLTLNDLFGV